MNFAGIDIGSTMTKVVIVDEQENIIQELIGPTGAEHRHLALTVMKEALEKTGLIFEQLGFIVATGYGRINVPFADKQITEITCHARGVRALFPSVRIVIDIGGQDSKGIKLNQEGRVVNFVMNDKCAAGTGRFLEVIAETLGIELTDLGRLSLQAENIVQISNTCTVFAEHEVTSRLAEGAKIPDICAGLHEAIAGRVVNMVRTLGIEKEVVVTGGGAKNPGLVKAIEGKVGFPVLTPPEPLITGALGAALTGKDLADKGLAPDQERRLEGVTFFK
ncbi:MAG: 2-hydroxyglutaryl-CoA dehydratase [Deltaproteobacteria bacterium]|nr:2-hydroxyglutaryl-CoA dehydratase [Deltaproteobacteria bacterium]